MSEQLIRVVFAPSRWMNQAASRLGCCGCGVGIGCLLLPTIATGVLGGVITVVVRS